MVRSGKAEGLILARRNTGEADRLLTLFTPKWGLIKVVAKGVRKAASRRGGHVEPLTKVVCVLSGSRGAYFLQAVEPVNTFSALRVDIAAQAQAQRLAAVLLHLVDEQQPYEDLYSGLCQAWDLLPTLPTEKRLLLEATLMLYMIRIAGLLPNLEACSSCGKAKPTEAVLLDSRHGGWHCLSCHHSFAETEYSMTPELIRVLRFLAKKPDEALLLRLSVAQGQQLVNALYRYASFSYARAA
jgi:DNA repair protein RecO (recombination protein O)